MKVSSTYKTKVSSTYIVNEGLFDVWGKYRTLRITQLCLRAKSWTIIWLWARQCMTRTSAHEQLKESTVRQFWSANNCCVYTAAQLGVIGKGRVRQALFITPRLLTEQGRFVKFYFSKVPSVPKGLPVHSNLYAWFCVKLTVVRGYTSKRKEHDCRPYFTQQK